MQSTGLSRADRRAILPAPYRRGEAAVESQRGNKGGITICSFADEKSKEGIIAVQVQIDSQTVGYLSRGDAKALRDRARREGLTIPEFACKANIRGGWSRPNDDGDFGVRLDVLLYGGKR